MKTILPDALAEISRLNRAAGETVVNPTVTAGLIELEAREAKVDALITAAEYAVSKLTPSRNDPELMAADELRGALFALQA